jgi:D-serine deaminase-like pyridoxal phosphate-dependent protein
MTYSQITKLSTPAFAMMCSADLERHALNARLHHSVASAMGCPREADIASRTEGIIALVLSKRNRAIEQRGAD